VLPFYPLLNIKVMLLEHVVPYGINGRVWERGVLNLKQL